MPVRPFDPLFATSSATDAMEISRRIELYDPSDHVQFDLYMPDSIAPHLAEGPQTSDESSAADTSSSNPSLSMSISKVSMCPFCGLPSLQPSQYLPIYGDRLEDSITSFSIQHEQVSHFQ